MNKNKDIKQLHSENHANSTNSVRNLSFYVNIISKLVAEFVTELVEIVHFFNIVTNFSVQAMRSEVFGRQIHLPS